MVPTVRSQFSSFPGSKSLTNLDAAGPSLCVIGSSGPHSSCVTVQPPWLQQAPHFCVCPSGLPDCCRPPTAMWLLSRRLDDHLYDTSPRHCEFVDTSQTVRLCLRTLARHTCGIPVLLSVQVLQLFEHQLVTECSWMPARCW